jgi:hypothetical protein
MSRHPGNTNLVLYTSDTFRDWPIQSGKGPFIEQYLHRLWETMHYSIGAYRQVFAFRLDLRFPKETQLPKTAYANQVICRFIESFKAKIKHNRDMARLANPYAHDTVVRYVWAREKGQQGQIHFHLVILLNKDAFCTLGKFEIGRDNNFNRLVEAWASALGLNAENASGLVEIPDNACYYLDNKDLDSQRELFYRSSYLCKSATKIFDDGSHSFGNSRN